MVCNGLISLVCAPQLVQDHFLKKTLLTQFFVPKRPIFEGFGDFRRAQMGHRGLKQLSLSAHFMCYS